VDGEEIIQTCAENAPNTEAELVRGLLANSAEAHGELYERFAVRMQRFAAARLPKDAETAEDIAVETLILAAKDIRHFKPKKSSFVSWLYGIARRRIIQELRLKKRLKSVPSSAQIPLESVAETDSRQPLDEKMAARIDAQRQITLLSQALSQIEMEVLILNSMEELSLQEIGKIVGRSERAVHSLLHRARKKAQDLIASGEKDGKDEKGSD